MARPRTIAPAGETRVLRVVISDELHDELREEGRRTGRSMGAVVRERLVTGTDPEARAS